MERKYRYATNSKSSLIYCGWIISIDYTADSMYWINRKGLKKADSIILESGEKFDIYEKGNFNSGIAIPA